MKLRYLPLALALWVVNPVNATTETYTFGNFNVTLLNSGDTSTYGTGSTKTTVTGKADWSSMTSNYKEILESAFTSWSSYFATAPSRQINVTISWDRVASGILAETWSNMQSATVSGASYNYASSTELVWRDSSSVTTDCDFYISFSTNYNFSYGDTAEAGKTDFQSVLVHEIMHNMGFNTALQNGSGYTGLYTAWDTLITDSNGLHPGDEGFTYKTGATYTIGDEGLTVYNPSTWTGASSMSHLDGNSCPDALMQAYMAKGVLHRSLTRQEYALLAAMGWKLTVNAESMYWVSDDGNVIKRNSDLLNKPIVFANADLTISQASSGETIKLSQLTGSDTSVVINVLTPDNGGTASVSFDNPSGETTSFAGRIDGNAANLSKDGTGTLALNGNVTTTGALNVNEGKLILGGTTVSLGKTAIASASTLEWNGTNAKLGKVSMTGGILSSAATTSSSSNSSKTSTVLAAARAASDASGLSASSLSGYGGLALNGDTLTLTGSDDASFAAVYGGSGTIAKTGSGTQALLGAGSSSYQLDIDGGTVQLANSDDSTVSFESVSVDNATLVLASSDDGTSSNLNLAKSATFGSGSTLALQASDVADVSNAFVSSTENSTFQGGSSGSTVTVSASSDTSGSDSLNMVLAKNATVDGGDLNVKTTGVLADGFFYTNVKAVQSGSDIVLTGDANTSNPYEKTATTNNTKAGATLLWDSHSDIASGTALAGLQTALGNAYASGDSATMARLQSACVGSTVTGILAAANSGIENELFRVRERLAETRFLDEERSHFWIEGVGRFDTLNASDDEAGFEWNSWGGALGADFRISERSAIGLSLTALSGDYSSSASDSADGTMDAEYLSVFALMNSGRWNHTVVLTAGIGTASYDRTVAYAGGSYRTSGDVDTTSFGALYQVTYDIPLNEQKTAVFQPLATISWHTASADDVTETGAGNANLNVSGMDMSAVTVTLGGRLAGVLTTNATGRNVTGELRVEVLQSMGDERAEADVNFGLPHSVAQKVQGAEIGTTGVRLGAGISIPVSQQGNVYGNVQGEIRSGASVVNAAIGFQYSF